MATAKNRAAAVATNAEIRRTKTRLLEELPKLHRLALKKVFTGLLFCLLIENPIIFFETFFYSSIGFPENWGK